MKINLFTVLALGFLSISNVEGQDSIPLLKGKVEISIKEGTLKCDFILSNVPRINDYFIRINSGMNVLNFNNLDAKALIYFDKSFNDTLSTGETTAYFFPGNKGKGKFLPHSIQFKYVGKYPVVTDTLKDYSVEDWKGNIAFNGYSVRTDGRQSGWYPVLYDINKDVKHDKVKYDIEISCKDCNNIYLNGNLPVSGTKAHFKSDIPQELTMFCGNYKVANVNGTYLLNPDISESQIKAFAEITNSYKKFYEDKLNIPYKQSITFIQTTPTSKDNAWLFVSYPTIVNIGHGQYGMKSFFNKKTAAWFKPYIAHELGHYYFGTFKVFNSELGDMMSEGFAEYLSLKVAKKIVGDSIYEKKLIAKIKSLNDFSAISFAKIKSKSDYNSRELYVYYYAPIIFLAIEKEIGEDLMWKWLKAILEVKTEFTNYSFLEQTLGSVLQDKHKLEFLNSKYFNSDKSIENAKEILQLK
jgi:hypothetical protein